MPAVDHVYSYAQPSALAPAEAGVQLALASDRADADAPRLFLRAIARAPVVTAKALRGVSEIVGARFYVPPSMLARILREADPVATVNAGATRFEGFSACCSAYARLDIGDEALDAEVRRNGTTNVDFGASLRAALAQVRADTRLAIEIGQDAVGIAHERAAVVERKVPLPVRWVKGFGEVQLHLAGMRQAFSLTRVAAQRFFRGLPRSKSDHCQWIAGSGLRVRVSAREAPGAVPLRGAHRLRVLEPLMPYAAALHVYANDDLGSSAWVLDFGSQRFTLALNAEPWRGFSGDGGLLSALASTDDDGVAAVRAQLNWQACLEPAALAEATGLDHGQVTAALARLAALGLVGFDLVDDAYFHRVLPFARDGIASLNPRLTAARALVEENAVVLAPTGDRARVRSGPVVHEVRLSDEGMRCTCPWYAKHKGSRGPCKHALAVEMTLETQA